MEMGVDVGGNGDRHGRGMGTEIRDGRIGMETCGVWGWGGRRIGTETGMDRGGSRDGCGAERGWREGRMEGEKRRGGWGGGMETGRG